MYFFSFGQGSFSDFLLLLFFFFGSGRGVGLGVFFFFFINVVLFYKIFIKLVLFVNNLHVWDGFSHMYRPLLFFFPLRLMEAVVLENTLQNVKMGSTFD